VEEGHGAGLDGILAGGKRVRSAWSEAGEENIDRLDDGVALVCGVAYLLPEAADAIGGDLPSDEDHGRKTEAVGLTGMDV